MRKLEKQLHIWQKYDVIIQDQLNQRIFQQVEKEFNGKEFYNPHQHVVQEMAESTKIRIVYDATARTYDKAPSPKDSLETGPPL